MSPAVLQALVDARAQNRAVVLATCLADGRQAVIGAPAHAAGRAVPKDVPEDVLADVQLDVPEDVRAAAQAALRSGAHQTLTVAGQDWFLHVHAPALRLVVVGAVHVAQALAPLALAMGIDVTVIDPRATFNSEARLPHVTRLLAWPDEGVDALRLDARSALVVLAHDPKLDDPALDRALRSEAFYIGALGSRGSHKARLERLAGLGHEAAALARIRGPVGLALGSVTAAEIALSIVAEIVAVRRGAAIADR